MSYKLFVDFQVISLRGGIPLLYFISQAKQNLSPPKSFILCGKVSTRLNCYFTCLVFHPRDGIGTLRLWSNGLNTTVLNCIQNPAKPSRGWQHVYGITCSIWKDQSWVGENPKVKISPYIYIYTYIQIYTHQLPKNRPPKIGRSETHPPGHCEEFVRIDDAQKTQGDLLRSRHHGRFTLTFYRVCVCVCGRGSVPK